MSVDKHNKGVEEKKHTGGRPRKEFTELQVKEIERMALDNCHLDTIARVLGEPKQTIVRRFGTFIDQKRAQGRADLRRIQRKLATTNPAMAIFLGKNELGQADKHEFTGADGKPLEIKIINYANTGKKS